jgi:glucose/arabinose dehydrogenase
MRVATRAALLALAAAALLLPTGAGAVPQAQTAPTINILVLTEGNATAGQFAALRRAGLDANPRLSLDQIRNSVNGISERHLRRYSAVVFLNTTGDALSAEEQQVFEAYFRGGGGFVGVGSAIETNPGWQFLTDILGTRAAGKLAAQDVTNRVADRVHDASKSLPEYWDLNDTYYNWTSNVRGLSHVLSTVSTFPRTGDGPTKKALAGGTLGPDHPTSWCKDYQGGRSYYTNHGASPAAWDDARLLTELVGAMRWAAGQSSPIFSDCGATVRANYQQSFVAAPPNLSEPIGFDVLPDGTGRVIQTDRRGGVRLHDPATNSTTLLAQVPVYIANEDGMYGPEVDNNFNTNKWVYLFYSPPTVEDVKFADGTLHTVTTPLNDPATPANEQNAPNFAASLSAWDLYNGYFQLSRFKFVDASAAGPAHLDLASEQQILRVANNRGACCHVAGDIDFDSKNNLWMVTGDDTPAGGGNSGGFGPFNGQLTNESQTVAVAGATGGTFTLTFDGQTTAPIAFPLDNAAIEAALEALSNLDDVAVTGTGTRTVNFRGNKAETNVPLMTGNGSGLTGTAPTLTVAMATGNNGQGVQVPLEGGMFNAPFVDARRSAQNTNDLRGKLLRITVKSGDIAPAEENAFGAAYTVPAGNLFPVGMARTRPEVYAMGFRNPFRVTLSKDDVAYVSDYSPDSQVPQQFRGPSGTGRFEIVDKPANYGWPLCYKTDLPYYKWDFNTSTPLPSLTAPETHECNNPTRGPQNTSRWVASGGPTVDPGLEFGPPITNPEIWYSYRDNQAAPNGPQGTQCFASYGPGAPATPVGACPQLFPELFTGGVGPHGTAPYDYDPANPNPTKFPPYWDGAWIAGEFTQDTMREVRMDSDGNVLKINNTLPCGPVPATPTRPWLCDNPMDMEFGPDGTFYLLTYGDGFFAINPDAGMMRWEYVKGLRAPVAVLTADKTSGPAPLTVNFSSAGSNDADPGDSIRFEWDFDGNGTVDSIEPNPSHTYTTRGQFTAKLSVIDSSGKVGSANTTITVGNAAPVVNVTVPVDGGTFAFGDNIPYTVSVTDDTPVNCANVVVTFVLGHDTHGHAEATTNGCTGVLPTLDEDVSHGGNVFGVISASYTDTGGAGGVPALTTVDQNQIRQKRQEVEFVLNQSGTNTAPSTDVGGGLQRGSLSAGDWMELNGPYNLLNINSITFRVTGGTAGGASGTAELWRDGINAGAGGTMVASFPITGATAGTYESRTFPLADPGGTHRLFLVFPNANTYSLNWVEFGGAGVGTP